MASSLIAKLTAQKDGEAGDFLNDLVRELWPNINVAGCNMIKEIVEPMFKTMLPGPLKSLHFTKLDLDLCLSHSPMSQYPGQRRMALR